MTQRGVADGRYLTVTERGVTRLIPRGDPPSRSQRPPALVGDVLPPEAHQLAPAPIQTRQTLTTTHLDRAKGFTLSTVPLAAVVGVAVLLAAIGLAGVPWMSWSALLILFGVFAGVWLAAYLWHELASPDGATVLGILLAYRFQRHEQKARLDRLAAWEERYTDED